MKPSAIWIVILLGISLGGKLYLERSRLVSAHSLPDLKPLQAGYQGASLEKYAFGYRSLLGALLWVQLLQKGDYHPVSNDEVSWEFAQIDSVTTLDPNNDRAYYWGAAFLSTLRRDKLGGRLFLEKWVKKYPSKWRPTYYLGTHHHLELQDYATAAPLILKASKMAGAPDWLAALGIRLMSESGALYSALKVSLELATEMKEGEGLNRLIDRIRSLNYNLQKAKWEESLSGFRKTYSKEPDSTLALSTAAQKELRSLSSTEIGEIDSEELRSVVNERFSFRYDPQLKQIVSNSPEQTEKLERTGIFPEPGKEGKGAK